MDLRGRKVIVTGGVKGIGRSLVEKLIQASSVVAVFDIDVGGLKELKQKHANIYCKVCDVSNYEEVKAAVDAVYREFNNIDILVNNAAFIYNSPLIKLTAGVIEKHDVDMWNKVITTDLSSVFFVTVNVVEKMVRNRTNGVIVNVSSVCAYGNAGQSAYSAAKAGINSLTATWAKELNPLGIRVAAIAPGYTETDTTVQSMNEEVLKNWKRRIPLRRLGKTDEISDGIISIIKNDFFNGKVFELDGGLII
jgi:3-oxoacyl-[acyl-carrier protein] reductase